MKRPPVILSGASASRSEASADSKDPYLASDSLVRVDSTPAPRLTFSLQGSFDSIFPFASEWKDSAQDDIC
jgi:hypothetical protein